MNNIEEKRNKFNLDIRELLSVIDMIDGKTEEYQDYKENTMGEEDFLNQQIDLINKAKTRLVNIFKD